MPPRDNGTPLTDDPRVQPFDPRKLRQSPIDGWLDFYDMEHRIGIGGSLERISKLSNIPIATLKRHHAKRNKAR